MIRVVLDANVLAPGFLGATSASAQLIELWRQDVYELAMSEHLLGELVRPYTDPYFRRRISSVDSARVVALLRRRALFTELTVTVTDVATQPKDELVLATGLSAEASHLATRDKQQLKCGD
ncbi:MAG TPA: putative toxin-antitoxin system toxin component, PIN family [Thermomicrobiales bacterium]|nr:putative toxin-antitoxin system toxin component, PIN family [Thermomicrobiales bacterium]